MKNCEFFSRRNKVRYDEKEELVIKEFIREEDYGKEVDNYHRLQINGFNRIPRILLEDIHNQRLKLEFIPGKTVLETFEDFEKHQMYDEALKLIQNLLLWLDDFYTAMNINDKVSDCGVTFGDVNLRNFIVKETGIIGFDFESTENRFFNDEKMEILARLCLYDPKETVFKKRVTRGILQWMSVDENTLFENGNLVDNYIRWIRAERKKRKQRFIEL